MCYNFVLAKLGDIVRRRGGCKRGHRKETHKGGDDTAPGETCGERIRYT